LWPVISNSAKKIKPNSPNAIPIESIIHSVLKKQKEQLDIPKRLLLPIREICLLQYRFLKTRGKQPQRLLAHPRFRAAYDLLLLRAESGEAIGRTVEWWTKLQMETSSSL